ncbi:MAG: hypothetical protein P8012_00175 [Desulfobacterales bacterium]
MSDVSAQALCQAALRKNRAIDANETPDNQELADCFAEMLRMLKSWAAEGIMVPYSAEDTHTLAAGTQSYTVGSGGDIDTERPIIITSGTFVRANGQDTPLKIIGEADYQLLQDKTTGSDYPNRIWYKPEYPLGIIYLWPPGGGELHLWSKKHFTEPADVTQDAVFEQQFQDAIVWNLACRIAPEFLGDPTQFMLVMAAQGMKNITNLNAANNMDEANIEISRLNSGTSSYNIDGG